MDDCDCLGPEAPGPAALAGRGSMRPIGRDPGRLPAWPPCGSGIGDFGLRPLTRR